MSINKFIGIGHLGRDPEYRVAASGNSVANISIAVTDKYKDKDGIEKETTEWINVVFFGKLADIVEQYVKKGMQVYVEGKLKTDKYEKDGITRYSTKVVAEKLQMLGNSERKPKREKVDDEEKHQLNKQTAEQDSIGDDDIPF
jgi:single-strand DNA-binding protein